MASHPSGQLGPVIRPFAPSLLSLLSFLFLPLGFHGFHFGGSPPLNRQLVLGGPLNLNFYFFSPYSISLIFLSISFVSDHHPLSLRRTNASFVTRVTCEVFCFLAKSRLARVEQDIDSHFLFPTAPRFTNFTCKTRSL